MANDGFRLPEQENFHKLFLIRSELIVFYQKRGPVPLSKKRSKIPTSARKPGFLSAARVLESTKEHGISRGECPEPGLDQVQTVIRCCAGVFGIPAFGIQHVGP